MENFYSMCGRFLAKHSSDFGRVVSSFTSSLSRLSLVFSREAKRGEARNRATILIPVIVIAFERFKERKQH